jgi:hypothetical protein
MITVSAATSADAEAWLRMRAALWPEGDVAEHREEIRQYFAGEFTRWPWQALIAADAEGVVGFAEVSTRPYAEG